MRLIDALRLQHGGRRSTVELRTIKFRFFLEIIEHFKKIKRAIISNENFLKNVFIFL